MKLLNTILILVMIICFVVGYLIGGIVTIRNRQQNIISTSAPYPDMEKAYKSGGLIKN